MSFSSVRWRLQRIGYLSRRAMASVAKRGLKGTLSRIRNELAGPVKGSVQLDILTPSTSTEGLVVPCTDHPQVSIVIPTYGKLEYTITCLRSVVKARTNSVFEIIVSDDASPDDSAATLRTIPGLRVISNARNLGFTATCNAGAAVAHGQRIVFLNNDTQVTDGWLDALELAFDSHPDVGIAGSKLIYPDGRLQEAGALTYADGEAWNYGRFEDPADPRFNYSRNCDYVSAAALMIDRALFERIAGFDPHFAPAYYEDMDLCFRARDNGASVVYVPESEVIHFEGISFGNDPTRGLKAYQLANKAKFIDRWKDVLTRHPAPTIAADAAIHHDGKPHILVMDALMPEPTRDSGSLRMVAILRILVDLGWRVTFIPDSGRATSHEIALLGRIGVETVCRPWGPNLATWFKLNGSTLKAALLCRHYVAEPSLSLLRRCAPQAKVLFDTVDLHFLREQRGADVEGNEALHKVSQNTRRRELGVIRSVDVTFVVSDVERNLLNSLVPEATVRLLSNIHEAPGRRHGFEGRRGVVFVGGFGHPPNIDSATWLRDKLLPVLARRGADLCIHLVGDMPEDVRPLFEVPGMQVHGRVPELDQWMDGCIAAVAPMRYGAGVKGKINSAMSRGLPVIATSIAAEGMHLTDGLDAIIADDEEQFADAILRLERDPDLWIRLSDHGVRNIETHFSIAAAREALRASL